MFQLHTWSFKMTFNLNHCWNIAGRSKAVVSKFIVCFFVFGIYKSFGVLLPHLVDGLSTTVASCGVSFGLYGGFVYLSGQYTGFDNIIPLRCIPL